MLNNLKNIHSVHFIGIGGIGMSALARMMQSEGKRVSGSDAQASAITETLAEEGVRIFDAHAASNIPEDADAIVYTVAIPNDNPELVAAREKGVPVLTYAEMLGQVSKDSYTIAVSGTHGKTTTTAMIAKVLKDGGLDPTVIVGSLLAEGGSNFVAGKSKYFVAEACEYKRSFLSLYPTILVITNIEEDHLDYYKDLADIQSAFRELAERVPPEGFVVCDPHDPNVAPVIMGIRATAVDYSKFAGIQDVGVPGEHNLKNARAAAAVASKLGASKEGVHKSLKEFKGTWRRFEYKGMTPEGAVVYDDYAHHPSEIRATLQGARAKHPDKRIVAAFQPHLYSRTKEHFHEFAEALKGADSVFLAPIYAAREAFDASISSAMIAEEIVGRGGAAKSFDAFADIESEIRKDADADSIVVIMGAGDIYKIAAALVRVG